MTVIGVCSVAVVLLLVCFALLCSAPMVCEFVVIGPDFAMKLLCPF